MSLVGFDPPFSGSPKGEGTLPPKKGDRFPNFTFSFFAEHPLGDSAAGGNPEAGLCRISAFRLRGEWRILGKILGPLGTMPALAPIYPVGKGDHGDRLPLCKHDHASVEDNPVPDVDCQLPPAPGTPWECGMGT